MLTRIAVLVSGGGTNLQALLDAEQSGALHSGCIALVLSSNPDAFALERARKAGVPAAVCRTEEDFRKELESARIQLVVLAGSLKILSPEFVRRWPNRIINIHPSLIPSFCGRGYYGLKVHEAALRRGVKVTGATVHLVNDVPDRGKILLQKAVDVLPDDTPETLQRRVMEQAEWKLLPQAVEQIAQQIAETEEII